MVKERKEKEDYGVYNPSYRPNKLVLSFWKIRPTIFEHFIFSLIGNEDIKDLSLTGMAFDKSSITYLSEYVSSNFNLK